MGGTGANSAGVALTNLGAAPTAAYAQANSAYGQANNSYAQANSAYGQANSAYGVANNSYAQANSAYGQANSAYGQANAAYGQANSAYGQANNSYAQANSAYGAANNAVLKAGDTMTGQLNISAGGLLVTGNSNFDSGTLFVDSVNDRIGIGTTSPSVNGIDIVKGGGVNTYVRTADGTYEMLSGFSTSLGGGLVGTISNHPLILYANNAERARITSDGSVLVGATNADIGGTVPGIKFNQSGKIFAATNTASGMFYDEPLYLDRMNASGDGIAIVLGRFGYQKAGIGVVRGSSASAAGEMYFATSQASNAGWNERMRIKADGNVGIGTTSPGHKLDVYGYTTTSRIAVRSAAHVSSGFLGGRSDWVGGAQDDNFAIGSYQSAMCFFTNNSVTERMRIDSSGNVGIGTTNVSYISGYPQRLFVNGTMTGGYFGLVTFQVDGNTGDVNHGILNLYNSKTTAIGDDARIMFSFKESDNSIHPYCSMGAVKEGSFQGALQFNTRSAGGSYTEKMRITSGGYVTIPNQPAFRVTGPASYTAYGAGAKITHMTSKDFDRTNSYSTSTQRFTAPVGGVYQFNAHFLASTNTNGSISFYLNGGEITRVYFQDERGRSISTIISLNVNDYVELYVQDVGMTLYGSPYSSFSGHLIG